MVRDSPAGDGCWEGRVCMCGVCLCEVRRQDRPPRSGVSTEALTSKPLNPSIATVMLDVGVTDV